MMSERQDPGGGALESHPFGAGFGPSSGKDHFSPTSTSNGNGLTDLSSDTHLTLLKSGSGLGSFSSYADSDGLSRLSSDGYMEMRYIQLGDWGDLTGFTAEGLSARLIDSRSLNDSPDNVIQYRPWEKPDPSLASPMNSQPTTTSSPTGGPVFVTTNGNGVPTTSNGKSPTTLTTLTNAFPAFSDAFGPNGQKLPSFQSQFNSFNEPAMHHHQSSHGNNGNGDILHSPAPVSTSSPPGPGTPLLPSFHTLPANRGYIHPGHGPPSLVTTTQAQPQFLDERHIQIFPGQIISATPVSSPQHHQGLLTNGNGSHHFVTSNQLVMNGHPGANGPPQPHFITGNGSGPQQFLELVPMQLHGHYPPPPHSQHAPQHAKLQPQTTDGNLPSLNINDLHHTHHNSNMNLTNLNVPPPAVPTTKYLTNDGHLETLITVKLPHGGGLPFDPHGHHRLHHHHQNMPKMEQQGSQQQQNSPQIVTNSSANNSNGNCGISHGLSPVAAKKSQKRKRNTLENSIENSYNSHNHPFNNNNSHDLNDPQVSSVSSTDSDFKRPLNMGLNGGMEHGSLHNASLEQGDLEKPVKKKRKRCGECTGCQRKDNCGDCAPCRNEKSHQICKVRRCEKLTEKKSCRKSSRGGCRDEVIFRNLHGSPEPIPTDEWSVNVLPCDQKLKKKMEGYQYKLLKSECMKMNECAVEDLPQPQPKSKSNPRNDQTQFQEEQLLNTILPEKKIV